MIARQKGNATIFTCFAEQIVEGWTRMKFGVGREKRGSGGGKRGKRVMFLSRSLGPCPTFFAEAFIKSRMSEIEPRTTHRVLRWSVDRRNLTQHAKLFPLSSLAESASVLQPSNWLRDDGPYSAKWSCVSSALSKQMVSFSTKTKYSFRNNTKVRTVCFVRTFWDYWMSVTLSSFCKFAFALAGFKTIASVRFWCVGHLLHQRPRVHAWPS